MGRIQELQEFRRRKQNREYEVRSSGVEELQEPTTDY
jgi:hypothetical protein